jgi:hypothetical protein
LGSEWRGRGAQLRQCCQPDPYAKGKRLEKYLKSDKEGKKNPNWVKM